MRLTDEDSLTEAEMNCVFNEFDKDGNGALDFDEFLGMLQKLGLNSTDLIDSDDDSYDEYDSSSENKSRWNL